MITKLVIITKTEDIAKQTIPNFAIIAKFGTITNIGIFLRMAGHKILKIQDLAGNILKIQDLAGKILKIQDLAGKILKIQDLATHRP